MQNEVKEAAPKYNLITPQGYLEMERAVEYSIDPSASLEIQTIDYHLPLSEIYEGTGI